MGDLNSLIIEQRAPLESVHVQVESSNANVGEARKELKKVIYYYYYYYNI